MRDMKRVHAQLLLLAEAVEHLLQTESLGPLNFNDPQVDKERRGLHHRVCHEWGLPKDQWGGTD